MRRESGGSVSRMTSQLRGLIEAVQQVGCVLAEQVHHCGVELRPAMPARDRHGSGRALSPAEDLDRTGQLHQPGGQADLVTPQVVGIALAIPLFVGLLDGDADGVAEADLLGEL